MLLPTVSNGASEHLTALPELREKVTGRAVPYPTRSRCRRTPPRRNQNHHENHAHQQRRTQPDDAHLEWRLTYDLRGKAVALGWDASQVSVIDIDQGQSGSSAADREGFQQLVAEVSLGRAGIVLGLECSRLARNNADWHQLLEICAMTGTLICDEDGLYDPRNFNDRLLLGMKGQMSEALCRYRHRASYADLVVMPTTRQEPRVVSVAGWGYPA